MNCLPTVRSAGLLWNEILAAGTDVVTKAANTASESTCGNVSKQTVNTCAQDSSCRYLDAEIDFAELESYRSKLDVFELSLVASFEESCLVLGAMTKLVRQSNLWLEAVNDAAAHACKSKAQDDSVQIFHDISRAIHTETRALRDQLHLQHTACTAAIQDALPILGAYGDGGSLRLPAASARQCVASSGSLLPSPASREEALQRPLLGLVKMDTLQVAAETWRLHPFFDSVQWSQSCDVLAALLRGLGSPQAAALPQALASFPELLQSVSPADFGQEFKADSAGSAAES